MTATYENKLEDIRQTLAVPCYTPLLPRAITAMLIRHYFKLRNTLGKTRHIDPPLTGPYLLCPSEATALGIPTGTSDVRPFYFKCCSLIHKLSFWQTIVILQHWLQRRNVFH